METQGCISELKKPFNILNENRHFYHLRFYLLLLTIPYGNVFAQSNTGADLTDNHMIWVDFYPHHFVSEKLEYYGDTGYRTTLNKDIWHWFHIRPSIRYHLNDKWEIPGGIGLFYEFSQLVSNRFEIRPWVGIRLNWPAFNRLRFNYLARFEARNSFKTEDWSYSFDMRFRFKIAGRFDFHKTVNNKFWFIPMYIEAFFPVNDNLNEFVRNRGRAGMGIGRNTSKYWRISLIVTLQTSRAGIENTFEITDFVYQIKIRKLWTKKSTDRNAEFDKNI